jgi:hypothetical protein
VGLLCCGTVARLFNGKTNRILSLREVVSAVNYSSVARNIDNGDLKLDVHNLFEKSDIQLELCKVRLSDAIKKKLKSVKTKDDIKNGISLNESLKDVSHKTLDFNTIVAQNEIESVNLLIERIRYRWNDHKKKFVDLHQEIYNSLTLVYAYGEVIKLKSLPGRAGENMNFDKIDLKSIAVLSYDLCNKSWNINVARRLWVFKKRVDKISLLTVLPLHDKIIVIAMQIVLTLVFEKNDKLNVLPKNKYLSEYSYGLRHNKGCHMVLSIVTTWGLCKWLISADIVGCFNKTNKKKLMSIIQDSIEDPPLINTFNNVYNSQITGLKFSGLKPKKDIGVFVGNFFLSMLLNIYLNEFDHFLLKLKTIVDKKKVIFISGLPYSRGKAKAYFSVHALYRPSRDKNAFEKSRCQLNYIRYISNYLIAVRGSKQLAKEVKKKAEIFLKYSLHSECAKRDLIDWTNNKVCFLGFDIKVLSKKARSNSEIQKRLSFKKIKSGIQRKKGYITALITKNLTQTHKWDRLKNSKVFLKINPKEVLYHDTVAYLANNWTKKAALKDIHGPRDAEYFNHLIQRGYKWLQELWVKKIEFDKLGHGVIAKRYSQVIILLAHCISSKTAVKIRVFKNVILSQYFTRIKANAVSDSSFQFVKPILYAPMYKLKNQLKSWDMLSISGKPKFCGIALKYHEVSIIEFFKETAVTILNYYNPALNFYAVKKLVDYQLRWSLLLTLTAKYSSKVHNIIRKFSKSPKITVATIENKTQVLVEFLNSSDINNRTRKFLKWGDPMSFRNRPANIVVTKQASNVLPENKCAILECNNSSMAIYYVKTLRRVRRRFVAEFTPLKSISLKKKVSIDSALNNKPMSLCGEHHKLWRIFWMPRLTKQYLKKHVKITLEILTCF